jgi:lipoprotein NlpI
MLLREQGDFEAAEAAYRQALDSDPGYGNARYNLAILLDIYLRRSAEALEEYRAYQQSLSAPDETVALWIVDLERQLRAAGELPERDEQRS